MSDERVDMALQELSELKQAVQNKQATTSQDKLAEGMAEITKTLKEVRDDVNKRKGEFASDDDDDKNRKSQSFLIEKSRDQKVQEFQRFCDDAYLLAKIMKVRPSDTRYWHKFMGSQSELRKAMEAGLAGSGLEWVPTEFSAELIDLIRLRLMVAALFPRIDMPTDPFKLPIVKSDATPFLVAEASGDTATKIPASTPGTRNVTLDAKKMALRTHFSTEITEDSIVPILPFLRTKTVSALADGLEQAIIDGDDSVTHQDGDVTTATDIRKAWKGLRKLTEAANKIDASTFDLTKLRTARLKMKKYGTRPNMLAWIVSSAAYMKFLTLGEVVTVEKFGPQATIVTGELGRIDGVPVIVSEFVRDDLNASGVQDGITTDKTIAVLVNRESWTIGDRRRVTVKTFEDVELDQSVIVSTQRLDFQPYYDTTTEFVVAQLVNVATTL